MSILKKSFSDKRRADFFSAASFLIIPVLFYIVFVIAPVIQGGYFSLYKWNGLGPLTNFVGLKNFIEILKDGIFLNAVFHNILIVILSLIVELPVALLLALAIGRKFKGSIIFRGIFFLPFILSEPIAGQVWQIIYSPQFGLQNTFLSVLIPGFKNFSFLGDPHMVLFSIIIVVIWKYFGLYMVIFIAGLQTIPDELIEAAYVDGVTRTQLNWYIMLPLLRPQIIFSIFLSIIGSFQFFALIWAMGRGDPVHAAETMVTYLYKFGFIKFDLGYGSAVAVTIFLICLVFNIFYQRTLARPER